MKCLKRVEAYCGQEIDCGDWQGGEQWYCEPCLKRLRKEYPQGWESYPGDLCKHGVYVGGSGPDYMCGRCEME